VFMDNTYHRAPPDDQPPPGYHGGYLETPYPADRPPSSADHQPDPPGPRWTAPRGYDGPPYDFRCDVPAPVSGAGGFGGPHLALPYGFDPSVPPPPSGCPPPGPFSSMPPTAPVNTYSSRGGFETFSPQYRPQPARYDPGQRHQDYEDFSEPQPARTPSARAEDETDSQRRQDQLWLRRFLQSRDRPPKTSQTPNTPKTPHSCVPDLRENLYRAAQLVSQLAQCCQTLRDNLQSDSVWTDSYSQALSVKRELQEQLPALTDSQALDRWRTKLSCIAKRRARRLRARKVLQLEEEQREERMREKEAAIDKWRMQQIHQVEEKKKERELKLAADAVLCEVRKKQADVKRMQDILRSLEKLRRLRKEAASRKGIITEAECDEAFSSRLEQLRSVMKKRTAVYSAEEKALMVMLEGEQEEERRREQEKLVKKERERQLQKKHRVDAMLFGDELPADSALQPFREYYTQAESSLHVLLQIRREWDVFVVAADHPDGSPVPQSWVLPDPPSDQAWASALQTADPE
ncbi:hypothetical protein L3Q82_009113, partial [Scortum barcoo]